MWLAGSKALDVYLSTRSLRVANGGELLVDSMAEGFESAISILCEWLESQNNKHRLRIWLSGGLCRPFLMKIPEGVKATEELITIASANATEATGLAPPCTVRISGKTSEAKIMAVATSSHVLGGLQSLRAMSIRPWWAAALSSALNESPNLNSISIQDDDSVTLLVGKDESYQLAATVSPVVDQPTAQGALTRLMFTHHISLSAGCNIHLDFAKASTANDSTAMQLPLQSWVRMTK